MKSNDLSTLWTILKNLRDNCEDSLLRSILDLAMLTVIVQRDAHLHECEPLGDPET